MRRPRFIAISTVVNVENETLRTVAVDIDGFAWWYDHTETETWTKFIDKNTYQEEDNE